MIYLMRHGEIEKRSELQLVGQVDVPLTDAGLRQAHNWRKNLQTTQFERIYSSDLQRCRLTAEILAQDRNQSVVTLRQLREINLGEWDGISRIDVDARFPGEWSKRGADLAEYRPPTGESFTDLQARVVPVFLDIMEQTQSHALIVAHAGVNRVIICHILGVPLTNVFRIGQDYACLNKIQRKGDLLQVVAMNLQLEVS
jgi:probable phosphoglycerate mutase